MATKVSLTIGAHAEATVQRYGFKAGICLLLADGIGGLWQMCDCGFGRELVAPFRSCIVADYTRMARLYKHILRFPASEICLTLCDCEPDFNFDSHSHAPMSSESQPHPLYQAAQESDGDFKSDGTNVSKLSRMSE